MRKIFINTEDETFRCFSIKKYLVSEYVKKPPPNKLREVNKKYPTSQETYFSFKPSSENDFYNKKLCFCFVLLL